ncbi:glycosyltransferase family 9 protein [Chitinophaga rhizophila]|uniref:Glycosyltransferase family 9 protein n=1 Tax=Chitinophaga rhizophila TaxID=2866212 RepID=A0ABS7G9Y8_9BACT|nr:glycosyltransferase family 9 protein [Chitinophaga rhizophila]MBW8684196.1 glycosyltransferase family 9 protein [Chitinophaga rhizophila]
MPQHLKTILAIRFSAMGDVAMTIPVMQQVLEQHPDIQIVFVSNKNWGALCAGIPRLIFHPADLKGAHNGFKGLFRLFRELNQTYQINAVADLHHVLRSQIVRTFFKLSGRPVAAIDKGRAEKKALARPEAKVLVPLTSTIERYAAVFRKLNLPVTIHPDRPVFTRQELSNEIREVTGPKNGDKWIGLAPFATYKEKTYPLAKIEEVLAALVKRKHTKVLLMGGGATEVAQLTSLAVKYPEAVVVAGRFRLPQEMAIISNFDVMISMDSANMHLASLFGVPVVSIWGATHPYAGFMGFGQDEKNAVQLENLSCRPCSIFGNKPCFRGDHACMEWIPPASVEEKVINLTESE